MSAILVTGAAGFIGSHVVDRLARDGHDVTALDDLSTGFRDNLRPGLPFEKVDVCDEAALRRLFKKRRFDAVIHEAARINTGITAEDPVVDVRTTVLGTLNLIRCCLDYGGARLVFASSVAVYGTPAKHLLPMTEDGPRRPIASYGVAKKCAEDYLLWHAQTQGLSYAILRYANVYGPRQPIYGEVGVVAIVDDRLRRGQPAVLYGDGRQKRDFLYVGDAVEATVLALRSRKNLIVNVGSGNPATVNEVFGAFKAARGAPIRIQRKPLRTGEIGVFYPSVQKARKLLGFKAKISLREGISCLMK